MRMDYKKHLLFSILLFLPSYYFAPLFFGDFPTSLCLCLFGSLLPDIDHKNSKLSKLAFSLSLALLYASLLLFSFSKFQQLPITSLLLLLILPPILLAALFALVRPRHRGITHSVFFAIACTLAALAFFQAGAAAFAIGIFSHLLSDRHLKLV